MERAEERDQVHFRWRLDPDIDGQCGGGRLQVAIKDNGIGMSAETVARVFRPFEQGEDGITKRFGGLGLGMAISNALMECQGGSISAQSGGQGMGSTFTITLDAVEPPVIAGALAPVAVASKGKTGNGRRLRILVVEDHVDTAEVLSRVLRSKGHEVKIADSVASATSAMREGQLGSAKLSDLGLPDGSGIDLIREVRRQHKFPAIALTGFGMDDDVVRCRDAGFDGHLTKPVSFEKLHAMIGQFTS